MLMSFFPLKQRSLVNLHDPVNCLQSFGYNSVTLMRRNRVIILKTASAPYVIVVLKQKQPVTFSCVALFLLKKFLQKLHDDVYQ